MPLPGLAPILRTLQQELRRSHRPRPFLAALLPLRAPKKTLVLLMRLAPRARASDRVSSASNEGGGW